METTHARLSRSLNLAEIAGDEDSEARAYSALYAEETRLLGWAQGVGGDVAFVASHARAGTLRRDACAKFARLERLSQPL